MELKVRDAFGLITPLSGTPFIELLNGTTNGSNFWNRLGSRISMKNIYLKLLLTKNTAYSGEGTTQPYATYRMSIVYDKQTQGAAPLVSDIWANISNTGSLTSSLTAAVSLETRDRFVILWDRFITTWPYNTAESVNTSYAIGRNMSFKKFMKLKNAESRYNLS